MELRSNLAHEALHALKWQYAGTAVQVGLRFIIGIALARLLSPEEFGLVAMALIPIGFANLVSDLGFATAIIQRPTITLKHIRAAFTGTAIIGMLLFWVLWCFAPSLSRVFMEDSLTPLFRMIGLSFLFSGMSAIPICLLRRDLRFRTMAIIETSSYVAGYGVVGVLLALLGYGVWSLVAANVVQPLCLFVLALYSAKQPVWPYFGVQEYRDLVRVASAELLNNVTNYLAEKLDFFVVGKWLGASTLGLYNRSFYLMTLPVSQFSAALLSVMFPLYSKIQDDVPRLGKVYLRTVCLTSVVTMPILFGMAASPEVVISGLFGEQWKAAAGTLRIMCLSGILWAILYVGGALSHARGYVFNEWGRQVIYLVVMGVSMWCLLPLGIEGVALAVSVATLARYLLLAHLSIKLAGVSWREFFVAQAPGSLLGLTVFASVYLTSLGANMFEVSNVLKLPILVSASMVSWVISVFLFPASWFGDLYPWASERFVVSLPSWVQKMMAAKIMAMRVSVLDETAIMR